ncbi:EmrB/QacA subfamily drug resistance transporter [Arthrobacter stackebrandtii]|uniref:EmrB/QacA subfamily drug resistance transporter n=1 Tax=Arthrobacter stackebrandtii TaxID=272161 RepID=A0ABS4YT10_9MICC|nr:MDR family MFS transporter [Arthrobacter stackebrandtii]MBP2411938.1 EmrB/QacA subfamily drug resistance transporter [Arthrobacter stackebrandtii]PYG99801.1 MFS transporter [Arthrobacter stackebrandtii]
MSTQTKVETPADPGEKRKIVLLFSGLMVTMLLASLNQTVLSSALPTMVGELNGVEHMAWAITAFILASTIMMPVYGKLGDLLGRKPMLLFAISIFTVGSVIGALAPDMTTLIVARVVQGLGGGGLMILSQATIADVVPARERGKYMGIMGGVFAFSSVAGPLIGGGLTEGPGWRWTFWMNVPLAVLAILATIFLLHVPKIVHATRPKIDYLGMMLIAIATTALVLVGTWGGSQYDWNSPEILGLAAIAIITGVLFVLVELRAAEPVLPMMLFKNRNFNLTTVAGLLTGIAMFGAIGYMPTYMQMATGYSATEAGLLMIPMMACMLVVSVIVGRRVSTTGRYKLAPIVGSAILAVGLLLMATLKADTPVFMICVYLGIMGIGLGASMQILTLVAQNSFPLKFVGTATAGQNYFRQVGATLGSAVVGAMFATRLTELITEKMPAGGSGHMANSFTPALVNGLPEPVKKIVIESYNEALIPLFLLMVPLAVVAAIILCFVKEVPLATKIDREAPVDITEMAEFEADVTNAAPVAVSALKYDGDTSSEPDAPATAPRS